MFRKNIIQKARQVLNKQGITQVCTDMLKGVSEKEIEENFEELLDSIINDTLYWEQGY